MMGKKVSLCLLLFLVFALAPEGQLTYAQSAIRTWDLSFTDVASGGTLVLMRTINPSAEFVSIPTSPGESAESVASRLASAINSYVAEDSMSASYDRHKLWHGNFLASASRGTVRLSGRVDTYALGGTETGLGIPMPPVSLSCVLEGNRAVLRWINSSASYDFVLVKASWMNNDHTTQRRLPGSAESLTIDLANIPLNTQDMDFRVTGVDANVPSNAAAIHVSGSSQAELDGIPFTGNIAPNWKAWTTDGKPNKSAFECADRYPQTRGYIAAETLQTKPFYQVIKAPGGNARHGIYRKFLGLAAGHTYRLVACVSTLDMDSVTTPWSLSICATASASSSLNLTAQQMAGAAALPNGKQGPKAGCVSSFAPGRTTKGQFNFLFTGERDEQGEEVAHITLPPDADTIIVWLRFSCGDPQGKVAFCGMMLEDITANPNVTPPDEVRERAHKAEERLWRGIAGQLEQTPKQ